MAPRPPRVAFIIRADERWDYWARLALYDASQRWGGVGYVLVPHSDGSVHPSLLECAVAYDPDLVIHLHSTVGQYEAAFPGQLGVESGGRLLEGEERQQFSAVVLEDPVGDEAGDRARDLVAGACTPHRQLFTRDSTSELETFLTVAAASDVLPGVQSAGGESGAALACPPDWSGPLAVATAARFGLSQLPVAGSTPNLDDPTEEQLVTWLLSVSTRRRLSPPPDVLRGSHDREAATHQSQARSAFDLTMTGLTSLTRGHRLDQPTVLVVGDAAEDFALAMMWDRTFGNCVWLPRELQPTGGTAGARAARLALDWILRDVARWRNSLCLASCSLVDSELRALAELWDLEDRLATIQSEVPKVGGRGADQRRPVTDPLCRTTSVFIEVGRR